MQIKQTTPAEQEAQYEALLTIEVEEQVVINLRTVFGIYFYGFKTKQHWFISLDERGNIVSGSLKCNDN